MLLLNILKIFLLNRNYELWFISRDKTDTTPFLDFKFDFEIPIPRNWRIITDRDELGRIVKSDVPSDNLKTIVL